MARPSRKFHPIRRSFRKKIPRRQYNWIGGTVEKLSGAACEEGFVAEDLDASKLPRICKRRFVEVLDSLTGEARVMFYREGDADDEWQQIEWHKITVASYGGFIVPKGERLWVTYHQQSSLWLPDTIPIVRFEVNESFRGWPVSAYLVEYTNHAFVVNEDVKFGIYDAIGAPFRGSTGARGYAKWACDAGCYEIIQLACP